MKIAIDAMGGDKAPGEIVKGALQAVQKYPCEIVLVGDENKIREILTAESGGGNFPITVRHASEVIEMGEHPADAVRNKKDSSIVIATKMVKDGECDAVLSAGSTGAAVAAAQLILRRIPGIHRPAIATPIPTPNGTTLLLDSGANVDSKPENLVQSGIMGALYAEYVLGVKNPSVALLNIGEEDTKGDERTRETYKLMSELTTINFAGNAEGRDIPRGKFDVVVCDGFVGNVVLKFGEGLALTIMKLLKEELMTNGGAKLLGADLMGMTFSNMAKRFDASENGGAPLLGINGYCIISHGSSNAKAICSAIGVTCDYVAGNVVEKQLEILNGNQGDK
ncbi:MAG: phosphate acyltransferase PlsX [Selenomonadaceae bacterium]|nr:phosphate acyltransferase PlsX [Selenomonadaceae bacterium]